MWGLPQKQNTRRADKIRLCGHLRRYKKIVKKTYIIYFKLDMSDIDNGNITIESNFYNETVIYKNETKTDVLSEVLFDGTKENKATLHAISEDELKENGIDKRDEWWECVVIYCMLFSLYKGL